MIVPENKSFAANKGNKDFFYYHIEQVVELDYLQRKFKLYFHEELDDSLIPARKGNENLKVKKIDGFGTYLYFSKQGKMQFHEFVLDLICKSLKQQKIPFRRPNKKRGSDLIINKIHIELEIRSDPSKQPENRPALLSRIKQHPDSSLILCLTERDKKIYRSARPISLLHGYKKILTVKEFLTNPRKYTGLESKKTLF